MKFKQEQEELLENSMGDALMILQLFCKIAVALEIDLYFYDAIAILYNCSDICLRNMQCKDDIQQNLMSSVMGSYYWRLLLARETHIVRQEETPQI